MKRLLLISPLAPTSLLGKDFFFRLPCLSLLKVAAATPGGWEVKIIDEKVEPLPAGIEADLVGITAMTCTANRAYALADSFRQRGLPVVLGGMHPSSLPDEALAHADSVVVGEAEGLWPQLIADFEAGALQRTYRHAERLPTLAGLPPADWSLYADKRYLPVHFVETTRGCPLDCEFCAVTNFFGGRYRNRPVDEVLDELDRLHPFDGRFILKNVVFFVDDNILSNRAYTRDFLTRIQGRGLRWLGHASVSLADDPEILRLCQASGCMGVLIGFETLSAETMRGIGNKSRLRMEYTDAIQKIHDHGIGVDGSFVFGFDTDDEGVFDRTLDFVLKTKMEVPYFSILTPYPGTRLYERMEAEGRLLSRDWSLYDTSHVVYRPTRLSPEQLQAGYDRVFREAYSVGSLFRRLWGTTSYKNFFLPMNLGFRSAVRKMTRAHHSGNGVPAPMNGSARAGDPRRSEVR
ncbi:MAG: B12-binding domain-containing radical SAM protein [Verrucomicrobiales bacterium]|nr:B12-binding domain-containing radical SAM protein [Verrucomicrobiales bacterium]